MYHLLWFCVSYRYKSFVVRRSCCSWNNALAIESVEAQRAELAELQQRDVYESAAMDALNANAEGGENRMNKTELFTIYYPNLLVPLEEADQLTVGGKQPGSLVSYTALQAVAVFDFFRTKNRPRDFRNRANRIKT